MEPSNDARGRRTRRGDSAQDQSFGLGGAGADGVLGGSLDSALAQWMERAIVDEAAAARVRRHWLTVQAEGDSSLAGVLVDLGERGRPVVIVVDDATLRGRVVGMGADFVVLERDDARVALVPTAAIAMVRSSEDATVWGDREVYLETTLEGIIGSVAAERPEVAVWTQAGMISGVLRTAGHDVLRIRLDGGATTWVALAAVRILVLN